MNFIIDQVEQKPVNRAFIQTKSLVDFLEASGGNLRPMGINRTMNSIMLDCATTLGLSNEAVEYLLTFENPSMNKA